MISSLFQYYNHILKKSKKCVLSKSFLNLKNQKQIFIIDYPNVIYILHEKYKNKNNLILAFYNFLLENQTSTVFIISKKVIIDNEPFDIETIIDKGAEITGKSLNKNKTKNKNKNLIIINLDYQKKISSSIDDLIGYFICFVIFVYLSQCGINPARKLKMVTNDKQFFDKNLFGKTDDERKYNVNITRDLKISFYEGSKNFGLSNNVLNERHIKDFLKEYIVTTSQDTEHLECNLSFLNELLLDKSKSKTRKNYGYFTRESKINPHFSKNKFSKKIDFSYENINSLQKTTSGSKLVKRCKTYKKIRDKSNNLKKMYYLYAFIKYVQMSLNTLRSDGKDYGDFYGGMSKESILALFDK